MNGNPPPLDSFEALHAGIGKEFSAVDIVNATLERIVAWEPRIAAWSVIDAEGALIQARDLDDRIARGDNVGPLAGLVVGIKDIFDVAGLPTTNGVIPN